MDAEANRAPAGEQAGRGGPHPPRAILLDALGTLVALDDPAPRLVAALAARGVPVEEEDAARAFAAEMAYYRANLHLGRDRSSLAVLRRRCAAVMAGELPPETRALGAAALTEVMLESLHFIPYPDAQPALESLRRLGLRLVVVSNWDCSLREMLARTGLWPYLHGAVGSAELGAAKPDPAPFRHALAMAGVSADAAWHVGDQLEADVDGARGAGIEPVLVDRWDLDPGGVRTIRALTELPALVG
jgi:putative hydrolase of the HAD superfamily